MLCSQDCCIGTPIQRYVAQTYMPEGIEVHLFPDGTTELDYTYRPAFVPVTEYGPAPHVCHAFNSLGSALDWARANAYKLTDYIPQCMR